MIPTCIPPYLSAKHNFTGSAAALGQFVHYRERVRARHQLLTHERMYGGPLRVAARVVVIESIKSSLLRQ